MKARIVEDYEKLKKFIDAHKILEHRVVCTIGSWDMLHIGHLRYLIKAKEQGDVLVVGVDSDAAIKRYKNPLRPIIPQTERMEMLSYQDCVDYVTLVDDVDAIGAWQYKLINKLTIDAFVCVTGSYPEQQKKDIRTYVKQLIEFPRQAENTSTTNIIEKVMKTHLGELEIMKKEVRRKQKSLKNQIRIKL